MRTRVLGLSLLLLVSTVSARKYIRLRAKPGTYYGDRDALIINPNRLPIPAMKVLQNDIVFDIHVFDRITIDRSGTFDIEGGTISGHKISFWELDQTRQYMAVMSVLFASDQASCNDHQQIDT